MILHFIKIGWRHISNVPVVTFIQVAGLIIGLTVFLLISLWVNNQLSFDKFGKNDDRIYRAEMYSAQYSGWTEMPLAMGPFIKEKVTGVENYVRLKYESGGKIFYDRSGGNNFQHEISFEGQLFADSSFFSVFPFHLIYGNPNTALSDPSSLIITESIANKIFNDRFPVGKKVMMGNKEIKTITGVIRDVNNFHIPFEAIESIYYFKDRYAEERRKGIGLIQWDSWWPRWFPTYVLLAPHVESQLVAQKITTALTNRLQNGDQEFENQDELRLRPVKDIYLHGKTKNEYSYVVHGNVRLIAGLSLVAMLILFLAVVNFVNLNATRTFLRTREVGIRKIAGSSRKNIFNQFTGELVVICLFSFAVSILLIKIILPNYNNLIGTRLAFNELFTKYNLITIGGCLLFLILLAGIIPSWIISTFRPVALLKNIDLNNYGKRNLKSRILLALQYGITIIVLSVTILVQKQLNFMKNSDPGFNMSGVLVYGYDYNNYKDKMDIFKNRLLEYPGIQKVTFGHSVPSMNIEPSFVPFSFRGKSVQTSLMIVQPEYLDFLDVPVLAGRNFRAGNKSDIFYTRGMQKVLLNETAVKAYGLDDPVGTIGKAGDLPVEIIGVVKDFYCNSLKNPILPLVFINWDMSWFFMVKCDPNNLLETKEYISKTAKELLNKDPYYNARSLNDIYNRHYESDENLGQIFLWFSILSVIIAALGLYGISVNAIQRRTKEIGIRKSNGATAWNILIQILFYFGKIIIWSGVIAIPVSWYLSSRWIKNYPYKTKISWWIFIGSLGLAALIALVTICWKAWKTSNANPVKALKYE